MSDIPSNLESIPEVTLTDAETEQAYQMKARWERPNGQLLIPLTLARYIVYLHQALAGKEADCIRLHKSFMDAKYPETTSGETTAECKDCDTLMGERDFAQDALQRTHIALGGDGGLRSGERRCSKCHRIWYRRSSERDNQKRPNDSQRTSGSNSPGPLLVAR